jgi:3-hydroxyacyl-CoA dehydrogenase
MVALYGGQARAMLEEGALPHQIDQAAAAFGMAMGPLNMR